MTAPLTFLKVTFVFLACTLMIACHSDGNKKREIPDINTFNIYTSNNIIYSFNEETGISTQRGEFDSGEKQFVELNTDEDTQGFEYAVYVDDNSIYLLNYDKESNAKTIKLAEIDENQVVCGLIPRKRASKKSFVDNISSNRSTIDFPIISIEYQESGFSCSPNNNSRDTLDFSSVLETPSNTTDIKITSGKSEFVLGGLVADYDTAGSVNQAADIGSRGFLGQNLSGNQITFDYIADEINDNWSSAFMPSTGSQVIKQVTKNHVLVQNDEDLFVLNAQKLFTVNTDESSQPVQEQIDIMFSTPVITFNSPSAVKSNIRQNDNTFLVQHENTLYFYESQKFTQIPSNETPSSQNAQKIYFDLTSDDTALVIQEENGIQTLIAISTDSGESTTILSAIQIEFYIINNQFYVNTLELEAGTGWQAHWFKKVNNNYTSKTYENSRFIFAVNLQEQRNDIYLLSSNDAISDEEMIKPSLYKFDSSQRNGRKKGRDSNNNTVDFSFGKLNTDVSNIETSIIVNELFAKITLQGINEDTGVGRSVIEQYYFNPSQSQAAPDTNEQSLQLMTRTML